jgi:hypothetical protein
MITNAPSVIIKEYLVAQGFATEPSDETDWPIFRTRLPDGNNVPHNAMAVYDTDGVKDGRLMVDGEPILRHGIIVLVRSPDFDTGWTKAGDIADLFDRVFNELFEMDDAAYTLCNCSRTTGVIPVGQEEGTKRRYIFSINMLLTVREDRSILT